MTKQRNRRLLAVLMAVCVILASGPVALATQAAAAFAVSSVEPGHEHGDNKENGLGVGAAHEEPGVALEADNGQGTQSNQVSSSAGEEPGETHPGSKAPRVMKAPVIQMKSQKRILIMAQMMVMEIPKNLR